MANRRSRKTSRPPGRDDSPHRYAEHAREDSLPDTLATLLAPLPRTTLPLLTATEALDLLEDRRRWHPDSPEPIRTAPEGRPARMVVLPPRATPKNRSWRVLGPSPPVPVGVAFEKPAATPLCIRRETRRQVMHATGQAGGPVRPPKFTRTSSVSCKKR